nr:hypothetical protein [Klebsiella pneumoniae subsp. pneumoniae]
MKTVQPTRMGISTGLWQSLAPDLWAFISPCCPSGQSGRSSRMRNG